MTDELRFVHFTDTHVVGPGVHLREVDTCRSLERVVEAVNGLSPRPAFVIVGGDLVSPDISSDSIDGHRDATDASSTPLTPCCARSSDGWKFRSTCSWATTTVAARFAG